MNAPQPSSAHAAGDLWATARRWLHAAGDERSTQRLAATVFTIRVLGAALAYISQVLFARWLGESDYGVYAYVWTWLITLGSILDLGMAVSAQKFIPLYRHDNPALLRGFLRGSRRLTFAVAVIAAASLACVIYFITPLIDPRFVAPFYLGCLALPAFVMANMQDGIARSHDWMKLAQVPQFVARHALTIGFAAGLIALGMKLSVTAAMACSLAAIWLVMSVQMLLLQRRIASAVETGPSAYAMRTWLSTAFPILLVEGFYLLLANTDIVVLQIYRTTAEVGVYFAVIKTFALVLFVHYALATTAAHRFSEFHAAGDNERLARYVESVIKWTFWPSLAVIIVLLIAGRPLLSLFGERFADGFAIMPVFAIGILARAAIGPVERLLNMLGEQRLCAAIYALAFAINLAGCLLTVPRYGGVGAAASTSLALVIESILLFWFTRRRLGFHAFALTSAPGGQSR